MAQAQLEFKNKKDISTQTGDFEYFFNLSNYKNVRVYFSKSYKQYVLSINFGQCKKYIITTKMWKQFRRHIKVIDFILSKNESKPVRI